jgi:hypothetical protein
MWDFWWTEWRCGRFSAQSSFPSASFHCANCSLFVNHQIIGAYEYMLSGMYSDLIYIVQLRSYLIEK